MTTANVYLEIRAGTGGDEAAIFAGDLFRMYSKLRRDACAGPSKSSVPAKASTAGYKEIVSRITGSSIYGKLKFESGAHRVQRVPATESQGRIHTSVRVRSPYYLNLTKSKRSTSTPPTCASIPIARQVPEVSTSTRPILPYG